MYGCKIYQTAVKYSRGRKIYQHFSFRVPPKYTQIGTFGVIIYHLATLLLKLIINLSEVELLGDLASTFFEGVFSFANLDKIRMYLITRIKKFLNANF
jgi:hypothetical protein